jgi:hypothetical protein
MGLFCLSIASFCQREYAAICQWSYNYMLGRVIPWEWLIGFSWNLVRNYSITGQSKLVFCTVGNTNLTDSQSLEVGGWSCTIMTLPMITAWTGDMSSLVMMSLPMLV